MRDCAFCSFDGPVLRNGLAYACFARYPVCPGHLMVLTLRHVPTWFDANDQERAAVLALIDEGKRLLDGRLTPDGYNIGINVGEVSVQMVMHLHVHLIPRYRGDVADPRGGIRGVIPQRQYYQTEG